MLRGSFLGNADGDAIRSACDSVQEADMVARIRFAVPMLIALATVPAPALTSQDPEPLTSQKPAGSEAKP